MKNAVKKKRIKWSLFSTVIFTVLILYCVMIFSPMLWGLLTSFKDEFTLMDNYFGLPDKWVFSNYIMFFTRLVVPVSSVEGVRNVYIENMALYSVLYAGGRALCQAFVPFLVAYIVSRFKFKFNIVINTVIVVCTSLPVVGTLPAQMQVTKFLGIYDTIWGMWIMGMSILSYYYLVFLAFFQSIPDTYVEAAKIDGAGNNRIMFTIVMPFARNIFMTVLLLFIVQNWNDYLTPMMFVPSYPTLSYGILKFNTDNTNEFSNLPAKICGSIIMMVPILIVFFIFEKRFMGNISAGGIKE